MANESAAHDSPTNRVIRELAQIAYQAYGDSADWKNYAGLPMPAWGQLTPAVRRHWRAAVSAVAAAVGTPSA